MKSQAEEDLISPISGFIHLPEMEIYINLNAQKKLPKNLVTCNWLICFATKCTNHHFSAHKSMWRIKIRYLPKTCTGAWGQITQMRWVVFTHIHPASEAHIVTLKDLTPDIKNVQNVCGVLLGRSLRSCRKSVLERPRKSDASQGEKNIFFFLPS